MRAINLTSEIRSFILGKGAALVGVAPVERFAKAPKGYQPQDILPEATNVIVFAFPMLESTFLSPNPRIYVLRYHQLREISQNVGYEVCRFIEDRGFNAVNLPGTAPLDVEEKKILFGDFSYRHAAVEAGLGQIGWNQLLITPEFGPRVWLMAVITSAPLLPDARFEQDLCQREDCNLCIKLCPQGALTPGQPTDKSKCTRRPKQYGLSHLIKHIKDILNEKDMARREELLCGPTTWALWMHLQYGGPPDRCHICLSCCPIGKNTQGFEEQL